MAIAEQFYRKSKFPHCIGAMDGKHVTIQAPIHSGSDYYNYKSNFSIVLFALVDADYNFIFADVGCQGRISDGGVFKHSVLYRKMEDGSLNLPVPEDSMISNEISNLPYVFVADEAFALHNHIMKPYSGNHERGSAEWNFNKHLSRARTVVENVFGILSSVFRVLRKPMLLEPETAETIVMATICLHNFLRRSQTSRNMYTPNGTFDYEDNDGNTIASGQWRQENNSDMSSFLPMRRLPRKPNMQAKQIRDEFAKYITNSKQ